VTSNEEFLNPTVAGLNNTWTVQLCEGNGSIAVQLLLFSTKSELFNPVIDIVPTSSLVTPVFVNVNVWGEVALETLPKSYDAGKLLNCGRNIPSAADRRLGCGPIFLSNDLVCAVPVSTTICLIKLGISRIPNLFIAIPCTLAAAPAIIAEALDVPPNPRLYHLSSDPPSNRHKSTGESGGRLAGSQ
jgi:hypothetical protein